MQVQQGSKNNSSSSVVSDNATTVETVPRSQTDPVRPAQKESSTAPQSIVPSRVTRTTGRKRPAQTQPTVTEPAVPPTRRSSPIPPRAVRAGQKERSLQSKPERPGSSSKTTTAQGEGGDPPSTDPSALLHGLTAEQLQAIIHIMRSSCVALIFISFQTAADAYFLYAIDSESPAAGNVTQTGAPSSSVRPQSSASTVPPLKPKKAPPRRSAKAAKESAAPRGNSPSPAEGSSEKVNDAPVAPRGSKRLKEKGKVVYSPHRGIIKPTKRSTDEEESYRPRKRTAL